MKTTLKKIKQHSPCLDGWKKLLTYLNKTEADDEELSLLTILESNGFAHALWALQSVDGFDKQIMLMACDFAESVVYLAKDGRSVCPIKEPKKYTSRIVTKEDLEAACGAARAAYRAASDAVIKKQIEIFKKYVK